MNDIKKMSQSPLDAIQSIRRELTERFSVTRIGVFGSAARGELTESSDVDILVELSVPSFDNYMELKFYLEKVLRRPVDLVPIDALKPRLKPVVEQEVIYAEGPSPLS